MKWSDEQHEDLRRRWKRGDTKAQIRRDMQLTTGQLAGKIMRLNLHPRGRRSGIRLSAKAPAVVQARSQFQWRVREPHQDVLQPGNASTKLGGRVEKGRWRGFPIYSLTLEERATCPRACLQWRNCYGNSMQWAARFRHGPELERRLREQLDRIAYYRRNVRGFVVRLHVLGDFYSTDYVALWLEALVEYPHLHVFGYTAWQESTKIGDAVAWVREQFPRRFRVRHSGAARGFRTRVIPTAAAASKGEIVCPVETGRTRACATCALCWSSEKPIAFVAH